MCPLTKTVQEIEERVDNPPGHIAAEHFDQHSAALPLLAARALNVHVSVRTMMSPNKNSEILSTGSKTRLVSLVKFAGISMVRSLFPERDNGFKCGASRYF